MKTYNREDLLKELWQKYATKTAGGYQSDRKKISEEFLEITGETIANSTISNYTGKWDLEELYNIKNGITTEPLKYGVDKDGNITSEIKKRMAAKRQFTNRELLELHAINPEENEIKQIISNEWSMTNKDGIIYYNFQSKIIAVPIAANGLTLEQFAELMKEQAPYIKLKQIGVGERNLVIGLADMHFGVTSLEQLVEQLSEICEIVENGYNRIVIEQLGDLFHSSQMKESITQKGTILQTVDMVKANKDAKSFFNTLIEHCVQYAREVRVEHACGNHSGNLEYFFMDALKDKYEYDGSRIKVNAHNEYRSVYRLGNVGIMISHGDTIGLKKLPSSFANEYSVLWGETETHEVHTGHKHNKFTEEEGDYGVVMRQFPTPKPTSDFEDKYGYLSRKLINAVEYGDDGEKGTYKIR